MADDSAEAVAPHSLNERPVSSLDVAATDDQAGGRSRQDAAQEAPMNPHLRKFLEITEELEAKEKSVRSIEMKMLQQERHYIDACPYGNVHEGALASLPARCEARSCSYCTSLPLRPTHQCLQQLVG